MSGTQPDNPAIGTYFEHRLFLQYGPDDFRDYLGRAMADDGWKETPEAAELLAWGLVLAYQSRLRPFNFATRLRRLKLNQAGNAFIETDGSGVRSALAEPATRMELTFQLAIEAIARDAAIEARIDDDPGLAQLAWDTLYYPASHHAAAGAGGEKSPKFTLTLDSLQKYLRRLADSDRGSVLPAGFPRREDVAPLFQMLGRLLELLAKPALIVTATNQFADRRPRVERRLWRIQAGAVDPGKPLVDTEAMAEESDKGCDSAPKLWFRFRCDRFGVLPDQGNEELSNLPGVHGALSNWGGLLTDLFGDAGTAHDAAGNAGVVSPVPRWHRTARAIEATRFLTAPVSRSPDALNDAAVPTQMRPELRLAAAELGDALSNIGASLEDIADALLNASLAAWALAPAAHQEAERQRVRQAVLASLEYLGARHAEAGAAGETPKDAADPRGWLPTLDDWRGIFPRLAWDTVKALRAEITRAGDAKTVSTAIETIRSWERELPTKLQGEATGWTEGWNNSFWAQWEFPGTTIDFRRKEGMPAVTPADLLHAAHHDGIPVLYGSHGTLSIGQWSRLLALPRGEVPAYVVRNAHLALGLTDTVAGTPVRPILAIVIGSRHSPAWQWMPSRHVPAAIWPPADVGVSDRKAKRQFDPGVFCDIFLDRGDKTASPPVNLVLCSQNEVDQLAGLDAWPSRVQFGFGANGQTTDLIPYQRDPTGPRDLMEAWTTWQKHLEEQRRQRLTSRIMLCIMSVWHRLLTAVGLPLPPPR